MLKMKWSRDRLIFTMGIPIPGKDGLDVLLPTKVQLILDLTVYVELAWWNVRRYLQYHYPTLMINIMQTIDIDFQDRHGWNFLPVSITLGSPFTNMV